MFFPGGGAAGAAGAAGTTGGAKPAKGVHFSDGREDGGRPVNLAGPEVAAAAEALLAGVEGELLALVREMAVVVLFPSKIFRALQPLDCYDSACC